MNTSIELEITDIAAGGQGIAQYGKKLVFVPDTIPGEIVRAKIIAEHERYLVGQGLQLLAASEDRVLPRCAHVARCNQCQWQHMRYEAQLALKTDIVLDQLERRGFKNPPLEMALPSPQQWHYRHEVRLRPTPDGKLGLEGKDGAFFELQECHLMTEFLFDLLDQIELDLPTLSHLTLRENGAGEAMLILGTSDDQAPELELDIQASVNFLLQDGEPANLIGATHLNYQIAGKKYRVTAGSYLRPNLRQIETMLKVAEGWLNLQGKETLLDLYSGVGIFAAHFAPQTSLITCVDSYPPAMTDAEYNLSAFEHVDILEGGVQMVLADLKERYDIAILDPYSPLRAGELEALRAAKPTRLILIHDNPTHFASDLNSLTQTLKYQLDSVQPIDFEPQTSKIICMAHLHRG